MIVNWPGYVDAGIVSDVPVVPADFFATMAHVTGATPRRPPGDGKLDGVSFLPVLTGQADNLREWALVEYVLEDRGKMYLGKEGRYVVDGRWKLYGTGTSPRGQTYYKAGQFFDLLNDPSERHPISPESDTPVSAKARGLAQAYLDRHPVPERLTGTIN